MTMTKGLIFHYLYCLNLASLTILNALPSCPVGREQAVGYTFEPAEAIAEVSYLAYSSQTFEGRSVWDAPEVSKVTTCFVLFAIIVIFGYLFR
jgi:hypothetical protein